MPRQRKTSSKHRLQRSQEGLLPPHPVPRPPSKPATNASSLASLATAPTRAVRSHPSSDPSILLTFDLFSSFCGSRILQQNASLASAAAPTVKFHRQTAPSGPGHHPPRSPSSSTSSLNNNIAPSRLPPHLDGFAIPSSSSVPPGSASFSGSEHIFNTPFTFNPGAPTYPQSWTTADVVQLPFSVAPDADMTAKYRAQFDSLRRAGPSVVSSSSSAMLPNMYMAQQSQPPSSIWYPAWARTHSLTSSEPTSFSPDFYGAGFIGSAYRPRRVSLDFSDSSSATSQSVPPSATSSNVHLPLTGNEMYDARPEETQGQPDDAHILQHQCSNPQPGSQPSSFSGPSESTQPQQPHRVGEGGFSSEFGLMSIDDPNALAGFSSDGGPFFSNLGMGILPHSPNATPMPTRVQHSHSHQSRDRGMSFNSLPTPGQTKEIMDSRELKDMWKIYLRSPLSGSGTATLDPSSFGQMPQSPPGQRRRVRVSSLPSVTPTMERGQSIVMNTHGEAGSAAGTGALRSTMHGHPDDLKSYEAAVNARNAPLKLNLVPRRKGTRPSTSEGSQMEGAGVGSAPAAGVGTDHQGTSRPSSSSSTSSFAQPYTMASHHHHQAHAPASGVVKPPPMHGASISLPIPPTISMSGLHSHGHGHSHSRSVTFGSSASLTYDPTGSSSRASSVTSDGTGTGGSGSDGEMLRPSFKRYPSQTLGPANSKRALVERGSGEPKGVSRVVNKGKSLKVEDRDERREGVRGENEGFERAGVGAGAGVGVSTGSPGSRLIAALPERAAKRG
ncbi:hypothetical protein JVU11DRAFT_11676 [Chiua virens]|nr:hypothetical protein JVU11DRAFT_11676 [Chiua virens]